MNSKVIIGLVVAVIIIGGGWWMMQSNKSLPAAMSTDKTMDNTVTEEKKKGYTLADVAMHKTESDCWMAINGKVYDATNFVKDHPGGPAILKGCGIDASILFNERPTDNKGPHPEQAKQKLESLYIGELQ
jgi:cytochrome b involved in lipid metabolism